MTRQAFFFVFCLLAWGSILAGTARVSAADRPEPAGISEPAGAPGIAAIRVGVGGVWKPGVRTPVTVIVDGVAESSETRARLTVPDGDGVPVRYTTGVRDGAAGFCAQFGRISTPVLVELIAATDGGERVVAKRWFEPAAEERKSGAGNDENDARRTVFREGVPSGLPIWLVVSREPIGVESAFVGFRHPSGRRPKIVSLTSFSELPKMTDPGAARPNPASPERGVAMETWEMFERVIVSARGGDTLDFDGESLHSLMMWVWNGGWMLVMVDGPSAEKISGEMGIFTPWGLERVVPLRETTELENLSGQGSPIPRVDGRIELAVPQFAAPSDVQTLLRHGTLPLVQRRPVRLGVMTWAGVAADDPALARWDGRGGLLAALLELTPGSSASGDAPLENETLIHSGFDDHAGQLRGSLDRFAGVQVLPFWIFVLLCVSLILLVGPLDWFVGVRWLKRPGFVGLLLVGVAACVAVPMALPRLKGDRLRVNRVELVDIDARTGMVRGNLWADFFSPAATRLDLSLDTSPIRDLSGGVEAGGVAGDGDDFGLRMGWFGLPGRSLGGLDLRGGRWDATTIRYDAADAAPLLRGLPVAIGSTKPVSATWTGILRKGDPADYGELTMSELNRTLVGTVRNPLSVPLERAMLVHGNWVWRLGTLPAGGVVALTPMSQRIDRRQCLARPQLTGDADDGRTGGTRYDTASSDSGYALQGMMFHEALGGCDFTRLGSGFRGDIDGSALLTAGRAVLVGSVSPEHRTRIRSGADPQTAAPIESTPDDVQLLFFRWFLPVERES